MGKPGPKRDRLATIENGAPTRLDLARFDPRDPERSFAALAPLAHRKRLGQFFTPSPIAELMTEWALAKNPAEMLDPAVGPGVFVRTARAALPRLKVTAIDVDPLALAALAASPSSVGATAIRADFLTWSSDAMFDAVLANPPYLRHHDLDYSHDVFAQIGERSGVKLSRLTNAYGLFLLEICRRLKTGGRAAVIVPGEWLNANFGAPLKEFLLREGLLRKLVYFAGNLEVFDDALTTACVLLIEKPLRPRIAPSLTTIFARSPDRLASIARVLRNEVCDDDSLVIRNWRPRVLPANAKWNSLLEFGAAPPLAGFVPLGQLADTRRGIATGANAFFHISREMQAHWKLPEACARPCVGRSADVRGYTFTCRDLSRLEVAGRRTRLLHFAKPPTAEERAYLREGERLKLHLRYLLAARKPWHAMETRPAAPIWAAVFGRGQLRFIHNRSGALNLTTFHCVYPHDRRVLFHRALTACLNSRLVQSLAASNLRIYGGGLLKVEPRDLLEIPVPDLRNATAKTLKALAAALDGLDKAAGTLRLPSASKETTNDVFGSLDQIVKQAVALRR